MKVTLNYFQPSGELYAIGGEFQSQMGSLHQIVTEVLWLKQRRELPGLPVGHTDCTILVTVEGWGSRLLYHETFEKEARSLNLESLP